MGCDIHGTMIVCTRGRRSARVLCSQCHKAEGTQLCDGPLPAGLVHRRSSVPGADTSCSRPLCRQCAHRDGDRDYCAECWPRVQEGRV